MSEPLSSTAKAELSQGISGGLAYYEFAVRGLEAALPGSKVLDLGCGTGGFGAFLSERFGVRPTGADIVRHKGFAEASYTTLQLADLDAFHPEGFHPEWDFVFALGLIEYLTNPRRLVRTAAGLLRPGGQLILTAPNPAALRSVLSLVRHGTFSAFQEATNPASITPVMAVDAERMLRECGLTSVETSFSNHGTVPGLGERTWQSIVPKAGGRWFSDDFRGSGKKSK